MEKLLNIFHVLVYINMLLDILKQLIYFHVIVKIRKKGGVIMNFGKNLRYLRKKWGYSQEDIAEKLGYKSYTTIQKWESGNSEPQVKVLNKIADMFNVSMNDLVSGILEHEETDLILSEEEKEIVKMYRNVSADAQKFIHNTIKAQQEPVRQDPTADTAISNCTDILDQCNAINKDLSEAQDVYYADYLGL